MSRWAVGVVVLLVSVSGVFVGAKEDRLRLKLGPRLSFEPGAVRVVAYVRPDPDNRRLVVQADSGSHYSSSDWPVDGERQPLATTVWLKNLPAGQYELRVTLEHGRGPDVVALGAFQVVGERR
jgi:hypothetical protein